MQAYLTPVLGEAMSRFMTDNDIRRGLAQGFAPGFPIPERFVTDLRRDNQDENRPTIRMRIRRRGDIEGRA